jgi:hypothetical protein
MEMPGMIFAYFGPETVLPLTSIVAAALGVVMMFGRNSFRFAMMLGKRAARFVTKGRTRPGRVTRQGQPHLRTRRESQTPKA